MARRPPNTMAEIGTPRGSSMVEVTLGHCLADTVKRELGCAPFSPEALSQALPRQSVTPSPGSSPMPSHQGVPSARSATLVKIASCPSERIALGFVFMLVPGATPNIPASGLMAQSCPSSPTCIQQMSSPSVSTFQPGSVGTSMARLVLPHALGNAAAT